MTQQVFAEFLGIAPATLSGIFTERTKPTINTVEAIKKKLPSINTDWLMFGKEPMYVDQDLSSVPHSGRSEAQKTRSEAQQQDSLFDFNAPSGASNPYAGASVTPSAGSYPQSGARTAPNQALNRAARLEMGKQDVNGMNGMNVMNVMNMYKIM